MIQRKASIHHQELEEHKAVFLLEATAKTLNCIADFRFRGAILLMVPPPINSVPFRVFPWTTSKAIIQGRNDIPHKKTERKASILDPRLRPTSTLIP